MTRADLYDWIKSHGCEQKALPEHKAKVVYFQNPKNDKRAWLNLPIDERIVKDFTIIQVCSSLGIPYPDCASHLKSLHEKIEDEHFTPKTRFSNKYKNK